MKSFLTVLSAFIMLNVSASAQTGDWTGKLDVNGKHLSLVFHLDPDNCTMDSPDQGARGIKAEYDISNLGVLEIKIPSLGASFEGVYLPNSITGTFKQNGRSFPLVLKPGEVRLKRPQTPVGPFPYETEEMEFKNGDAVLSATLTIPESCDADNPVLILITGSGLQNRDEEIYEHKPFAVIADAFARAGIATLRYDDRGFGKSTGDLESFTTEDLKNDALSGVELLRQRFNNVGALGHSEGGSIAIMLAAEGKVDFVISLAGGIIPMKETLIDQNRYGLSELGFSEDIVNEYVGHISAAFDSIIASQIPKNVDDSGLPAVLIQNYNAAVAQCSTPYMKYFISMDVRKLLSYVHCPVLAFNGTLDTQVDCEKNMRALVDGLIPENSSLVKVENVNHLFQHCQSGSSSEYKEIEETFAPEVLDMMTEWIFRQLF